MQKLRLESGFTLIEFVIVGAMIGIMAAMAVPSFDTYYQRRDARYHIQKIASALQEARSQAIRDGNNYFVIFDVDGVPGRLRIVNDDDNDWQETGGEVTRLIRWDAAARPEVTTYGVLAGPPGAPTVPEDGGGPIPAGGSTFPTDSVTALPAVGFNSQGIPVELDPPRDWGSGAGSYYVTDNTSTVYSVTLLPLGGVRVRVYRSDQGDWF